MLLKNLCKKSVGKLITGIYVICLILIVTEVTRIHGLMLSVTKEVSHH